MPRNNTLPDAHTDDDTVLENDPLARTCHPDTPEGTTATETDRINAVSDRLTNAKLSHNTYNTRLTLETATLHATVRLNDDTLEPRPDTATITRKTSSPGSFVLLEGEPAHHALTMSLTHDHQRTIEKNRTDALNARRERHPSLTVSERNPGL